MNLNKHIFQSSIMVPLARTILIIVCATAACVEAFIVTIPGRFPRVTGTRVGRPGEGSKCVSHDNLIASKIVVYLLGFVILVAKSIVNIACTEIIASLSA